MNSRVSASFFRSHSVGLGQDGGGGKRPRTKEYKMPFRRVKDEEIEVAPELADNSYEATFGESGWGAKVRLR